MVWFSMIQSRKQVFSRGVAIVAFASLVLPVGATELTKDNFSTTVNDGLWFVLWQTAPQSLRSTEVLQPTWDQLVIKAKSELPSVSIAQVNCETQLDLCEQNGIDRYPTVTVQMFDNGRVAGEFIGLATLDNFMEYLRSFVKDTVTPLQEPTPNQTDIVQELPPSSPAVVVLTSTNFQEVLNQGPAFVRFSAHWSWHCRKLSPVWAQLAETMGGELTIAEVDCYYPTELCEAHASHGYPTLIYFHGDKTHHYYGSRKLEELVSFAEGVVSTSERTTVDVGQEESKTDFGSVTATPLILFDPPQQTAL